VIPAATNARFTCRCHGSSRLAEATQSTTVMSGLPFSTT
jgi:hypothetical protein